MALSREFIESRNLGTHGVGQVGYSVLDITFDSSYPTGGEDLSAADLNFGAVHMVSIDDGGTGYDVEYDYTNNKLKVLSASTASQIPSTAGVVNDNNDAATDGSEVYVARQTAGAIPAFNGSGQTGTLTDSDTAASEGVKVYAVIDEIGHFYNTDLGHLEFVSPTNSEGSFTPYSGGPATLIKDDDSAASNGTEIHIQAAGAGLEADLAGSNAIIIPCGVNTLFTAASGMYFNIENSDNSSPPIYFDEDQGNTYERLRAVVVDDGNEPYTFLHQDEGARVGHSGGSPTALFVSQALGYAGFGSVAVGSGGPTATVTQDQGAPRYQASALLFTKPAGGGFYADLSGDESVYVELSNGEFIKVTHDADPASNQTAVQVYFNPNAASTDLSFEAVVVDNADETYSVATDRTMKVAAATEVAAEVPAATNLSAVTVRVQAFGNTVL